MYPNILSVTDTYVRFFLIPL